jgi:hypothetical protein
MGLMDLPLSYSLTDSLHEDFSCHETPKRSLTLENLWLKPSLLVGIRGVARKWPLVARFVQWALRSRQG